ncbi:MAG: hypothetical protein C0391_04660 [Anaerolinea sp.]|nr:hypothetical protein [Anaerolinea sp.]
MEKNRTILINLILFVIVLMLIIAGLTWANYSFAIANTGSNDFLPRWNGAHEWLLNGNNPYARATSLVAEKMVYGRHARLLHGEDQMNFSYPIYAMVIYAPFGLLDYPLARAFWMTALEISIFLLVLLGLRLVEWKLRWKSLAWVIIFGMTWYFSLRAIMEGSFTAVSVLLIIGTLLCIKTKHDLLAGTLMAFATIKPQLSYLLILFIILWSIRSNRHKIWLSFILTLIIMIGMGLIMLPGWPISWLKQLMKIPGIYEWKGTAVLTLAKAMPGIQQQTATIISIILYSYLVFEWFRAKGNDFNAFLWTAFVTLIITNLVAAMTESQHQVVLMPAIFLVSKVLVDRLGLLGRWSALLLISTIFTGTWTLFLLTRHGNQESHIMLIPLPVILLIGCWWIRWWVVKPPTRFQELG